MSYPFNLVKEGLSYSVKEGLSYPVKEGLSYFVKEGLSYPVKEGLSHPVKEGLSYPVKEGLSYPVKVGLSYPVTRIWAGPGATGRACPRQHGVCVCVRACVCWGGWGRVGERVVSSHPVHPREDGPHSC